MKAVLFAGSEGVRVGEAPEPRIEEPGDAIVEVRKASICGSDLHLLHGKTPGMREGAVIGHEFVGVIAELGEGVTRHHDGTRAVGSFIIACDRCEYCARRRYNLCRNRRALGLGPLVGDLDGAQAQRVRVPNADLNLRALDGALSGLTDEQALFAGDVMTTGFYAAAHADIAEGDTVVVIGGGPIGYFCALAAARRRAAQVVILEADRARVDFIRGRGLQALDVSTMEPEGALAGATDGRLADVVIEAVGHVDALRSALRCVRDGGRVLVVGVYGSERYELPTGRVWVRALDLRFSGMANIQAHWDASLLAVAKEELDPTALITHRLPLEQAPEGYELFASRRAMKVVLSP